METLAELPFIGDQVVCLSHELQVTGFPLTTLRPTAVTVRPGNQIMIPRGFLCSIAIALLWLMTTAVGEEILVEPTHVTIESKEGQRLRVVFPTEDRPALTLKPKGGAWDWSRESRLVIPVENPSDEALTLQLRVEDQERRSLTGKVAIAPRSSSNLAISISAPPRCRWA